MQYKSVRLPADFVDEIKKSANDEYRSISQQLMYWANLGKEITRSYFVDDDDEALGNLALRRYNAERNLAVKVNIDDL
jgi:hypothetical protein